MGFLCVTSDYFCDTVSEDQLRIKLTERQRSGVVDPNLFGRIRIRRNIVCYKKSLILFYLIKSNTIQIDKNIVLKICLRMAKKNFVPRVC